LKDSLWPNTEGLSSFEIFDVELSLDLDSTQSSVKIIYNGWMSWVSVDNNNDDKKKYDSCDEHLIAFVAKETWPTNIWKKKANKNRLKWKAHFYIQYNFASKWRHVTKKQWHKFCEKALFDGLVIRFYIILLCVLSLNNPLINP
jgi:hypothetical protein